MSKILSLDELYLMTAHIYGDRNSTRSKEATFAHFVEVCGMLTIPDRKKKREKVDIADALCKALGWYFPLLAKMRVRSVEALVFRKFPNVCPYCRKSPHEDIVCKQVRGTGETVNHEEVVSHFRNSWAGRPKSLDQWQEMFNRIYPRNVGETGRSTLGLMEELGELAEAVRVFDVHPQYFLGEAADIFSYIMGLANEHQIREAQEDRTFSFGREYLLRYPGLCTQCGSRVCICPAIPEATIGRMAKELAIGDSEQVFIEDAKEFHRLGETASHDALERMGGYEGLISLLPFDRGEANEGLVTLCLKIAGAVEANNASLAASLRAEALKLKDTEKSPGVASGKPLEISNLLSQLRTEMGKLEAEHLTNIKTSPGMAGNLGELLDASNDLTVLVAACNPAGDLDLDKEVRALKQAVSRTKNAKRITINHLPAATTDDLRRELMERRVDVVHFSGHANETHLVFANEQHEPVEVPIDAVAALIKRYPAVRCVILNACETGKRLLTSISPFTIAMDQTIPDGAALEFSKGFYDAVGAGKTIDEAFEEGTGAMRLAAYDSNHVRLVR